MAPKKEKASGDKLTDVWVVILCGLPGSGKSTLRERLVKNGWLYVSQDEMGTADSCEKALVKALKNQKSCIVDRCNVTSSERRLWMQYANRAVEKNEAKGIKLHFEVVWMATSPDVCKERIRGVPGDPSRPGRRNHPTLGPHNADEVIDQFCRGMKTPERTGQEPYECVQFVSTQEDADLVVKRYADPARPDVSAKASSSPASALFVVEAVPHMQNATVADGDSTNADLFDSASRAKSKAKAKGGAAAGAAEVFILRHGERADRAADRDGGWEHDPPLTKDGRETAKRAGAALRSLNTLPWAVVYSSPFYRCLQTANEAAAELGLNVRVEPGLSELCIEKIFEQAPQLRPPALSLAAALTRAEVDLSCAPHQATLPQWPEEMRGANSRVLETAQVLAARHPGQAILLVCHSHSLVELTRHLPKSGGGAASSTAGYCALSHIAASGMLVCCLDQSYLKLADGSKGNHSSSCGALLDDMGQWEDGWQWADTGSSAGACDVVELLLDMGLEAALDAYPAFSVLFKKGSPEQQAMWRDGWGSRDEEVRTRLQKAQDAQIFAPPSRVAAASGPNLHSAASVPSVAAPAPDKG